MRFVKRLVIQYILTFIFGLILGIIPLINPYIFISSTFGLLIFLFYALMIINLGFTILYVISRPRANIKDSNECFNVKGYKIIICHLCDYYSICKKRKNNEK